MTTFRSVRKMYLEESELIEPKLLPLRIREHSKFLFLSLN